jgi:hypothetical protein
VCEAILIFKPILNSLWHPIARNIRPGNSLNPAGGVLVRIDDRDIARPGALMTVGCAVLPQASFYLIVKTTSKNKLSM